MLVYSISHLSTGIYCFIKLWNDILHAYHVPGIILYLVDSAINNTGRLSLHGACISVGDEGRRKINKWSVKSTRQFQLMINVMKKWKDDDGGRGKDGSMTTFLMMIQKSSLNKEKPFRQRAGGEHKRKKKQHMQKP